MSNPYGIIAGGGLVGLTLALAMHAKGFKVKIYESVPEILPLGVGINLLPHSVTSLKKLGLLDDLQEVAIETSSLGYFTDDGKEIWKEPRGLAAGYDVPQLSIHRGDLHMILLKHVRERLGDDAVMQNHRLDNFEQDADGVTVQFTDHKKTKTLESQRADYLVGADGINSRLRNILYPDEGAPHYSGQILWRGVSEIDPYLDGKSMFMAGHNDLKLVAYPIRKESAERGKSYVNWIAERSIPSDLAERQGDWNQEGLLEEFASHFANWELGWLNVQELFEKAISIHKFPMIDRNPIPKWSFDRITLMGDAAHAMYPNGSNGVSQGVLDAMTFADLMEEGGSVPNTLQKYEDARREVTSKIVLANRETGPEKVMQMVHETCDGTCGPVHKCIEYDTLKEVANSYKKLAGFHAGTLNKQ